MMETQTAATLLGVKLPVTKNRLQTAFRQRSLVEHPDHSKHPEANSRFIRLKEAYDLLKDSTSGEVVTEVKDLTTETGEKLSDLGKGLGPTTNGTPCPECSGSGYKELGRFVACPDCRSEWTLGWTLGWPLYKVYEYRCVRCGGDGVFKVNGVIKGGCYACKATGWYKPKVQSRHNQCRTCNGTEGIYRKNQAYCVCGECKGTGEIPMFNPCLAKGLLR
jgi:DnaJ-class molecular chaperone